MFIKVDGLLTVSECRTCIEHMTYPALFQPWDILSCYPIIGQTNCTPAGPRPPKPEAPWRMTRVKSDGQQWKETPVAPDNMFCTLVLDRLRSTAVWNCLPSGLDTQNRLSWMNTYVDNAFIEEHTDRSGKLQVLVLLQGCVEDFDGRLHVDGKAVSMRPGDAIIVDATTHPHFTLPYDNPIKEKPRITGVIRFL